MTAYKLLVTLQKLLIEKPELKDAEVIMDGHKKPVKSACKEKDEEGSYVYLSSGS